MKHELLYAVVYDDGSWGGLWSTVHAAMRQVAVSRRREANRKRHPNEPKCIGVFKILKYTAAPDAR